MLFVVLFMKAFIKIKCYVTLRQMRDVLFLLLYRYKLIVSMCNSRKEWNDAARPSV